MLCYRGSDYVLEACATGTYGKKGELSDDIFHH
jgi:hypothetical protein